jgi:plasmid maintenance system antidote protein VapI
MTEHDKEYAAVADPNRCPPHPGDVIEDILPATGRTKGEIAALLGISRQQFHAILAGRKPVSAEWSAMALACGFDCRRPTTRGTPSAMWT